MQTWEESTAPRKFDGVVLDSSEGQCSCPILWGRRTQHSAIESLAGGDPPGPAPRILSGRKYYCSLPPAPLVKRRGELRRLVRDRVPFHGGFLLHVIRGTGRAWNETEVPTVGLDSVQALKGRPAPPPGEHRDRGEDPRTAALLQFSSSDLSLQSGPPSQRQLEWMHSPLRQ